MDGSYICYYINDNIFCVGLICSHMSAFRVASNMRKSNGAYNKNTYWKNWRNRKWEIKKIVNESAGGTETYLAHQLPDMAGALVTPICMLIFPFYIWLKLE